jgi:hypothetical protein
MSEHMTAALTGRPFDHSSMGRKLIAFSIAHRSAFARQAAHRLDGGGTGL